jgi:SAM-dependent methyltransferase
MFDVNLTLQDVFTAPTVDGMTQLVIRTLGERMGAQKIKVKPVKKALKSLETGWRAFHGKLPLPVRRIVPPGVPCATARSYLEYKAMFELTPEDLTGSVLDCNGGMSSLAAELNTQGVTATAVDPAYNLDDDQMVTKVADWLRDGEEIASRNPDRYTWKWYGSAAKRNNLKGNAAASFLDDFRSHPDRYVAASLPDLPFPDNSFDLVLCSHLLFTWANSYGYEWHLAALREMVRVARREVRVFPLVIQRSGEPVLFLNDLRDALAAAGHKNEVREVEYEFQVGARSMLSITP